MPAAWEYYCVTNDVPGGREWLDNVRKYDTDIPSKHG